MEQDDKVTIEHPEYTEAAPFRKVFAHVCAGTSALRKESAAYLPRFPQESKESYKLRADTATLLNVTQKTVDTLCGLVFQKDLTLDDDVPTEIAGTDTDTGLIENIDNKGNHLNVFARDVFEKSFAGCAGIFVDAPTAQAQDAEQERRQGIRPYWVMYHADCITNWDFEIDPVSKKRVLSLVVLKEHLTERTGSFKRKAVTQYRVLRLNESRLPTWELWTEKAQQQPDVGPKEYEMTANGSFSNQSRIPFAFIGEPCDRPPLMDLAYKNIEHFQTYSDYKSIMHKTCVPLFYTVNLEGEPQAIGGDIWFKCNEGGSIGFAEVAGTSIEKVEKCLENIKFEMAMLGLQQLAPQQRPTGKATATEIVVDSIQETSSLQVRATQLKDALELALGFTAAYLGKGEDAGGSIELGATWAQMVLTPEEIAALNNLVQGDVQTLSVQSFLWYLEKAGKLPPDITADDELKRIESEVADQTEEALKNAQRMQNETQQQQGEDQQAQPAFA